MTKMITKNLLLIISLSSCSTVNSLHTNGKKNTDIQSAIDSNNVTQFKTLIGPEKLNEKDRFYLLEKALTAKECRPAIVKTLLENNSSPIVSNPDEIKQTFTEKLSEATSLETDAMGQLIKYDLPKQPAATITAYAAISFCPDNLTLISEVTSASDFADGLNIVKIGSDETFMNKFTRVSTNENTSEELLTRVVKTFEVAVIKITTDCKSNHAKSCTALAEAKTKAGLVQGIIAGREGAASPDGILEEACFNYNKMSENLRHIADEKEKGKISGFVNASYMREWGDRAYNYRSEFNKFSQQYKAATKKTINPKTQCRE